MPEVAFPEEGYSLRLLTPDDQTFIWKMLLAAIYPPDPSWTEERIRSIQQLAGYALAWGEQPGDFGLALLEGSKPVGACWARFHSPDAPGYGFVALDVPELSIALAPEARGRGLGKALLQALLRMAEPRCRAVSLSVRQDNPALHLYEQLGFKHVETIGDSFTMWHEFDTQVSYQLLSIADYADAASLWDGMPGIGLSDADTLENIQKMLDRNPGLSYKAEVGGQLVGTLLTGHDGRRGYLYHLAVEPGFRKRGIGQRMVQLSLTGLGRAGIHKAHIFVYGENVDGIAFWRKTGWVERVELVIMSADTPRE